MEHAHFCHIRNSRVYSSKLISNVASLPLVHKLQILLKAGVQTALVALNSLLVLDGVVRELLYEALLCIDSTDDIFWRQLSWCCTSSSRSSTNRVADTFQLDAITLLLPLTVSSTGDIIHTRLLSKLSGSSACLHHSLELTSVVLNQA